MPPPLLLRLPQGLGAARHQLVRGERESSSGRTDWRDWHWLGCACLSCASSSSSATKRTLIPRRTKEGPAVALTLAVALLCVGLLRYECRFASEEKAAERLFFSENVTLKGSLDQCYQYCERELVHFIAMIRIQKLQQEMERHEARRNGTLALEEEAAATAVAATAGAAVRPPELPSLLHDLGYPLLSLLEPLFSFLTECHSILRSSYIFLCVHYAKFDSSLHPSLRSQATNKALEMLNQFEYFTEALDQTLIPQGDTRRTLRTMEQMAETVKYARKYAKSFAAALQFLVATELPVENEADTTKQFFAALDAAASGAGGQVKKG